MNKYTIQGTICEGVEVKHYKSKKMNKDGVLVRFTLNYRARNGYNVFMKCVAFDVNENDFKRGQIMTLTSYCPISRLYMDHSSGTPRKKYFYLLEVYDYIAHNFDFLASNHQAGFQQQQEYVETLNEPEINTNHVGYQEFDNISVDGEYVDEAVKELEKELAGELPNIQSPSLDAILKANSSNQKPNPNETENKIKGNDFDY